MKFADSSCIDSFKFFSIPLDETIANTYILVPFYCSGKLIQCLGYQEIRTILEQFEAEIGKRNSSASAESYWFL